MQIFKAAKKLILGLKIVNFQTKELGQTKVLCSTKLFCLDNKDGLNAINVVHTTQ